MLSMLAYFELLTQPDGSHRRRCCVRRIILTRTLAFMGCNGCRPLQGCCRRNTRRFHRQDRRKSTLECRQEEKAFPKTPAKNPDGRDSPTNAARASAAADPETSPTELRHSLAENAAAAALRTAAIAAAAAAKCEDPWILHTVLVAAAATANALAQTSAQDTVQAHRRGGRPPPMRRVDPGARPRRNRRPTGTAPRATGSRTMPANQTRQHDPPIYSPGPPRAGRARTQSGAQPPSFSNRSATLATGNIPPLSPTVMRRNIVDRA